MSIAIKPLKWNQVRAFANLRQDIEAEADHLVVGGGERKESGMYVLVRMLIQQRRMMTFIACDGDAVVGFITVLFPKFKKLRGNAYLTVSVRKSHQGKGIGTQLLAAAEAYARTRHARRMELEVFAKNERALNLYKRLGYEVEGRKRKAVHDESGFDDIIFMAKML